MKQWSFQNWKQIGIAAISLAVVVTIEAFPKYTHVALLIATVAGAIGLHLQPIVYRLTNLPEPGPSGDGSPTMPNKKGDGE